MAGVATCHGYVVSSGYRLLPLCLPFSFHSRLPDDASGALTNQLVNYRFGANRIQHGGHCERFVICQINIPSVSWTFVTMWSYSSWDWLTRNSRCAYMVGKSNDDGRAERVRKKFGCHSVDPHVVCKAFWIRNGCSVLWEAAFRIPRTHRDCCEWRFALLLICGKPSLKPPAVCFVFCWAAKEDFEELPREADGSLLIRQF